ncbi:MAG: ATP synthase subunit C [Nitrososphaerota archaeon]
MIYMTRSYLVLLTLILLAVAVTPTYAESVAPAQEGVISDFAAKVLAAAAAFIAAVSSAAWAISRAGSAGLAASAERPEVRTTAVIISAFAEALAIYGIVISFFILAAG